MAPVGPPPPWIPTTTWGPRSRASPCNPSPVDRARGGRRELRPASACMSQAVTSTRTALAPDGSVEQGQGGRRPSPRPPASRRHSARPPRLEPDSEAGARPWCPGRSTEPARSDAGREVARQLAPSIGPSPDAYFSGWRTCSVETGGGFLNAASTLALPLAACRALTKVGAGLGTGRATNSRRIDGVFARICEQRRVRRSPGDLRQVRGRHVGDHPLGLGGHCVALHQGERRERAIRVIRDILPMPRLLRSKSRSGVPWVNSWA